MKLTSKVAKLVDSDQWPTEALAKAMKLLEENGLGLAEAQREALFMAVEVAYRNENDCWDHEIYKDTFDDPAWEPTVKYMKKKRGY